MVEASSRMSWCRPPRWSRLDRTGVWRMRCASRRTSGASSLARQPPGAVRADGAIEGKGKGAMEQPGDAADQGSRFGIRRSDQGRLGGKEPQR